MLSPKLPSSLERTKLFEGGRSGVREISTTLGHGPLCPNKWTVLEENDRDTSSLKRAGYLALINVSRSKILNDGTDAKEMKVVTIDVITDIDTARHVAT
jgi:hypothetical protein